MEGEESLQRFSPEVMVQNPNIKDAVSLLPHFTLFHGTADYSIPSNARSSSSFYFISYVRLILDHFISPRLLDFFHFSY